MFFLKRKNPASAPAHHTGRAAYEVNRKAFYLVNFLPMGDHLGLI